jgi:hypothetical protein
LNGAGHWPALSFYLQSFSYPLKMPLIFAESKDKNAPKKPEVLALSLPLALSLSKGRTEENMPLIFADSKHGKCP